MSSSNQRTLARWLCKQLLAHFQRQHPAFNEQQPPPASAAVLESQLRMALQDVELTVPLAAALLKELGCQGGARLVQHTLQACLQIHPKGANNRPVFTAALSACLLNHQTSHMAAVFEQLKQAGLLPDTLQCNLLLMAYAAAGKPTEAFAAWEDMQQQGIAPNMLTYSTMIRACRAHPMQHWTVALELYASGCAHYGDGACRSHLEPALLAVLHAALRHVDNWQQAQQLASGLDSVGLERGTSTCNGLLHACGRLRLPGQALQVFGEMCATGAVPDTATYNALINACVRGGEIMKALEVFDWMVAGVGADGPVAANAATFTRLIEGCHQRGLLEKALEVMAWMDAGDLAMGPALQELADTADIAGIWDDKAIMKSKAAGASLVPPEALRPAPFDGMRLLYMGQEAERYEEQVLASEQLGLTGWAPPDMRPPLIADAAGQIVAKPLVSLPSELSGTLGLQASLKSMHQSPRAGLTPSGELTMEPSFGRCKGVLDWSKTQKARRRAC
ncbi:hypothetical protein WJX72_007839 [[Myrmecia] bisecta]|uniref:Pentatricopeptide repeat-containing protein n=1 Tax=[Myrmecia] bisecta TaxID=41462 RepID=A0AAW1QRM1_9CHLO